MPDPGVAQYTTTVTLTAGAPASISLARSAAPPVQGLYFPQFSAADANPDIGDRTITETAGYGGMAMAAAPAIVKFVGGTPHLATQATLEMYEITFD